jgi:mRNA-degrading endonuclease RelE of RelBE toxin-antitoxin system
LGELLLTDRAKQDLTKLPRVVQEAVVETLALVELRPEELGKELRGRLRGLCSCRVGNYRILYTIEGKGRDRPVIVRAIRHRGVAYRGRRARR